MSDEVRLGNESQRRLVLCVAVALDCAARRPNSLQHAAALPD